MKYSIIVVTYNRLKMSELCIESIICNTPKNKYELIVIDNASTDGTRQMIQDYYDDGIVDKRVFNTENKHLGAASNQGITLCDNEWIVLVSNDFIAMEGWIDNLDIVLYDLNLDYCWALLMQHMSVHNVLPIKSERTLPNNGCYMIPTGEPGIDMAGGLVIKTSIQRKYEIWLHEGKFAKGHSGPFPLLVKQLHSMKNLKGARLGKPCLLIQDPNYNTYMDYYKKTFIEQRKAPRKFERYLKIGSNITNQKKYYEGTSYLKILGK